MIIRMLAVRKYGTAAPVSVSRVANQSIQGFRALAETMPTHTPTIVAISK